jgi:hypothetical protein
MVTEKLLLSCIYFVAVYKYMDDILEASKSLETVLIVFIDFANV